MIELQWDGSAPYRLSTSCKADFRLSCLATLSCDQTAVCRFQLNRQLTESRTVPNRWLFGVFERSVGDVCLYYD